jgi:ribosomal protein L34E
MADTEDDLVDAIFSIPSSNWGTITKVILYRDPGGIIIPNNHEFDASTMVCTRCGFDLHSLPRVIQVSDIPPCISSSHTKKKR